MMSEVLAAQVAAAAKAAGLVVVSSEVGEKYAGGATTKFVIAPASDPAKTMLLELSEAFEFGRDDLKTGVKAYLVEAARRLKNPRPDCYVTLHGIPLSFGKFGWPFHESTSGADTSLVHGEVRLEDGAGPESQSSILHAKVAVSMTVTFRDVVPAPEQPFAEGFIYNAVRKTMDQSQLELVKSGNRQPVSLTTRFYSARQKKFIFNDTSEQQRTEFLATKAFWLSGILGAGAPVWMLDPRDTQYLDTTVEELRKSFDGLQAEGLIAPGEDAEFAAATPKLMERTAAYREHLAHALEQIKPAFNEEMRSGLTNM
jgi:hypothetical protein